MEQRKSGRGGRRTGAGRPRIPEAEKQERPNHGVRAWDDEWDLIKRYAKAVRQDKQMAAATLDILEEHIRQITTQEGADIDDG